MAHNYNGKPQFNGNRDGGFEDKSKTPEPVKVLSFYKDDNKTIKEDLFDTVAKSVAESFKGKNKKGFDIGVTSTQLRRIFEEVKRFEQILLSSEDRWEKQLPYIKMIKSKVAYTVARASKQKSDEKGVYKNLEVFISSCIDLIKKQEDYHIFVNLFEAAYGFYYDLAPKSCQ